MSRDLEADVLRLRTALGNLVALSAVPEAWVGREPPAIAAGLADVVVNSLHLDFAFVRLCDPNGGAAVEVARGSACQAFPKWLQQYLVVNDRLSHREVVRDIGSGVRGYCGVVIPIGIDAEGGLVAAACDRADFPSENDQLLLSAATHHASMVFRMSRLIDDHRRAEEALRESERQLRKARDELETKVAERTAELQRSEAYLAEAQRLSHTGSFGWDVCSSKLYWSEETFRIFEYDRADQPTVELALQRAHPDDRARVQQTIDCAVQEGKGLDFEHRLLMPDGKIKAVHVVGHPAFEKSGNFVEFVGTVMDVTERRRAEEERHALAHANRIMTMGQLTASLSHEITQPIASARNNARAAQNFLKMQPPDLGEVMEALACAVGDTDRAGDIIDRIRAHVKKAPPRKDRLDINEAIREVIELTRGEAVKNGVSVQTDLAGGGLPLIEGDRVQLAQVLLNLILNAIEAMSGISERTRELLISSKDDGADGVHVAVRDWGPGLTPESSEHLFDAFYTTKPSGMGMGLSICRSIIEAHGGRMWATANIPQGAAFQFTLPIPNEPKS